MKRYILPLLLLLAVSGCNMRPDPNALRADAAGAAVAVLSVVGGQRSEAPDDTDNPSDGECDNCYGTGRSGDGIGICQVCNGTGMTEQPRTVSPLTKVRVVEIHAQNFSRHLFHIRQDLTELGYTVKFVPCDGATWFKLVAVTESIRVDGNATADTLHNLHKGLR